jgi:DNA-binding NtrC family response regulator
VEISGETILVADDDRDIGRVLSSGKNTEALPHRSAVDNFRKELVERALGETGGNRVAAAKALGLHEKSLIRLIRALRIH